MLSDNMSPLSNLLVFQIKCIDMLKVSLIANLTHKIGIRHHNTNAMSYPQRRPSDSFPKDRNADVRIKRGDKNCLTTVTTQLSRGCMCIPAEQFDKLHQIQSDEIFPMRRLHTVPLLKAIKPSQYGTTFLLRYVI